MKTLLWSCTLFLIASTFATAQSFQASAKLYTNLLLSEPLPELFDYEGNSAVRFKVTPAFHLYSEEKWKYHELEISNLRFKNHERQLEDVRETLVGLRYEYGWVMDMNTGIDGLQLMLGISSRFFYHRQAFSPNISNELEESETAIKAIIGLVPRANYRINDQFSLDFNISVSSLSVGTERQYFNNPFLTGQSRVQSNFNTDFLFIDDVTLRLGIVYQL
ncbi:MAG: hypothetical protein AAF806_13550 [Bacteroidota bacterium]